MNAFICAVLERLVFFSTWELIYNHVGTDLLHLRIDLLYVGIDYLHVGTDLQPRGDFMIYSTWGLIH